MSSVLVSRQLPSGNVAHAAFLLDAYCLGVKNTFFDIVSRARYDMQIYGKMRKGKQIVRLTPESARKLVEGAVEYARECGLSPHSDYPKARKIFGDVDTSACTEEFEYGKDGKPCFVSGPHDTPARCEHILRILESRFGPNGFHFSMPLSDVDFADMDEEDA